MGVLLIPILIILFLVLLNGLFVSAEFSIIGVRPSYLKQMAIKGNKKAETVVEIVEDRRKMDRYIATAQLGITIASLGLGMYGEPAISHFLEERFEAFTGLEEGAILTLSFLISLSFVTYLHVVIGEMVPKSVALQRAARVVLLLSRPMRLAERVLSMPVQGLNAIGLWLLKLIRIPAGDDTTRAYTSEEIEQVVRESYAGGLLDNRDRQLVARIFDFSERAAGQVMTPRKLIDAVPSSISEGGLRVFLRSSSFSRIPVYEETIDNIVGVLLLKDFIRQQISDQPFELDRIVREVSFVPDSLPASALLVSMRSRRQHMAVVIDEHGGTLGLVTLEDLLEEVVGEVKDEFDAHERDPIQQVSQGHLIADGRVLLETLAEYVELPAVAGQVQTLGGLLMTQVALPARPGDEVSFGDVRMRVEEVDGLTIRRVAIYY